jgi:taurine dioxygenase
MNKFKTEVISDALGLRIYDLDLSKPLDKNTLNKIKNLFLEHLMIVFIKQQLTIDEYIAAMEQFGKIKVGVLKKIRHPDYDNIQIICNDDIKFVEGWEELITNPRAVHWHSDECYLREPNKATALYCIKNPSTGGGTIFANMYKAYETLPDDIKKVVDGKKAIHSYGAYDRQVVPLKENENSLDIAHPVFRTHPVTGKKSIFVNSARTEYIVDMNKQESKDILSRIYKHSLNPKFQASHNHKPGDVTIWDNRCTFHRSVGKCNVKEERLLYSLMLKGEQPV